MSYTIKALGFFKEQVSSLDAKSKRIVYNKIQLIKENPFRYKKIHSRNFPRVFRVRLDIQSKETRLVYAVIEPNIILVCLLDRKNDYKDLEKHVSKLNSIKKQD
jgi:mRNA-degrading endonuclease RelE of RelBE toxin-antitoxin system